MIEFVYPWCFVLLFAPLLVRWLAPAYKERKSSVQVPYFARLVTVTGEKPESGAVILNRKVIQRVLLVFTWLCLVTAMAKPEKIGEPIIQQRSARDLMIAVDLSGSMAVEDFTSSAGITLDRLTAVKQVLTDFVKARQYDRLGLILFGDAPYIQAPFTNDLTTWLTLLNESNIGMAGQSTAIGDAIGLSISAFDNAKTKNKVLILLTDGNDTGSKVPPIEAAIIAAAAKIKIYTIAIGDPKTQGEEKINEQVLKRMAKVTGGTYFQAMNRDELQQVYQQIDALEPQQFDIQSFRPRTSLHHYPVILFILLYTCILLTVVLTFRVKSRAKNHA